MKIAGFKINSFVDFPKRIAAVIFTLGCNFDCWYCHNKGILKEAALLEEQPLLDRIKQRIGFLDGVVVTGGEPTLQPDLVEFFKKLQALGGGLELKLDTNGSNPAVLAELLQKKLVQYVAMDIKCAFSNYPVVTRSQIDVQSLQQSIRMLKESNIEHEFRTTLSPDITLDDLRSIVELIGTSPYYIQQYRPNSEDAPASLSTQTIKDYVATLEKEFNRPIGLRNID